MNKLKIDKNQFLQKVEEISQERPQYKLGHDGTGGLCDCIGLIIGSIRRSGGTWDGIHGSNYAARNEVEYLLPVSNANELSVGEVVFKASSPGQSNYNLPSRYDEHPDRNDYYHAGVVTSVSPLVITHCTGPGIVRDKKLGKWNYRGWLKKVDQEEGNGNTMATETRTATVYASQGSTVNMRKTKGGELLDRVPVGAKVTIQEEAGEWAKIAYGDKVGWMMKKFLLENAGQTTTESGAYDKRIAELEKRMDEMETRMAKLDGGLG